MINQLSKEILDTAYYGFMYEEDYPVSNVCFSKDNLENLNVAIKKMFRLLNIEKDFSDLDKIRVFFLDKATFCFAYYCSVFGNDFLYTDDKKDNVKDLACKLYKKQTYTTQNDDEIVEIIEVFKNLIAHANKTSILINKTTVPPQLGLHLVCHEIMHSLASPDAVGELRKDGTDEKTYGDEAINEYFARLATLIFNSIDVPKNKQISGYTNWNDEEFFNFPPHSKELGLYGELLANLRDEKWNDNYDAVESVKELARFYFLGEKTTK